MPPHRKTSPAPILTLRALPGQPQRGLLTIGVITVPAAIGRSGRTSRKREGDGGTPIATMPVLEGFWRADRGPRPLTRLPMKPIAHDALWCDAPRHPLYNRPARKPLAASHEEMRRDDELYDICIVLDWNVRSRKRYGGSAIFFHLARPGFTPTEGCVAISEKAMRRLLPVIGPGTRLRVV
ncbi:L,D-peptidoglycan transpeptidase YkuD, ErfK/YbiS/YcfS/YnhG family [Rhizobium sp. RU20A]|uniref:L,D-transpeptidase family protein n=1 Tax=Rhizobium sp. RU20A TaxID=1907412 RepID=UPI0009562B22|nr:L,D-transpeptidase family protein [Rhizobium sp. RU20A]SIQ89189.1 L,D-peptidoglycan transpeptidase YkuD, ErfK/YbiS/YcfS/YnhG family [Rhizobium sp. RU20A]